MQRLLIAVSAAVLSACGVFELEGLDAQRDAQKNARARWSENRPAEYSYTLHRGCFCLPDANGPVRIHVRGDSVLSRIILQNGRQVPADHQRFFGTMEDLFDLIDQAIRRDADKLVARYDARDGHLISADIDYDERATDEELGLRVTDFIRH